MTYSRNDPKPLTQWSAGKEEPHNESLTDSSYIFSNKARIDYTDDPRATAEAVGEIYAELIENLVRDSKAGPLTKSHDLKTQFTSQLTHVPDLAIRLMYLPDLSFGVRTLSFTSKAACEGRSLVGYKRISTEKLPPDLSAFVDAFVDKSHKLGLVSFLYEKIEGFIVMARGQLTHSRVSRRHYVVVEMVFAKANQRVFRGAREPLTEKI